ncbi:hypothetical protein AALP_AA4G234500 [Arabis alpina]|uniref:Zinc knuckle CX2CX4HX4C domain-containing protein n=1 Tax=Arabis alpina TaxID=50452 RepID=A0A087H558_ARAAL|nr:hypothetical protein AALP_AA4G234500 [Arabis alpina]
MIALERWVPTVRRDFPSTIPFWITISGLPDYRREEKTVRSIGEDLGEFHEVDVSDPIPKVRVTLDCNAPLILRRETFDAETLCIIDLQYEKLHRYCTRCLRLTHEAPACPDRPKENLTHRETRREPARRDPPRRKETEVVRGRQRSHREERGKVVASTHPSQDTMGREADVVASSSKPKPVRRDLMVELESSRAFDVAPPTGRSTTKDWVRKTFVEGDTGNGRVLQPETKRPKSQAPWYRATEEEAAAANAIFGQTERGGTVATTDTQAIPITIVEETEERQVARVHAGIQDQMKVDLGIGPQQSEAQQTVSSGDFVDQGLESLGMGLHSNLSPTDIISPLKEMVNKTRPPTQRNKALGARKKITHNPFRGNRVHHHIALAALEESNVLAVVANPSSPKTAPVEGEISEGPQEPVVKEKPPAAA